MKDFIGIEFIFLAEESNMFRYRNNDQARLRNAILFHGIDADINFSSC